MEERARCQQIVLIQHALGQGVGVHPRVHPAKQAGRLGHKAGEVRAMRRGELEWRMASPPREEALDGLIPSLIEWRASAAVTAQSSTSGPAV